MDNKEIKKLLPQVIVENLSEERLSKLGEEFNKLVEAKVEERTQLAVECAQTAFNEEANTKLQALVCQIDEAHKKAFMKTFDAICEAYEAEISRVKRYYNTQIKQDSIRFQKNLLEKVANHIDSKIDSLVPTSTVKQAVKNIAAMQTLNSLRQMLNVNEATAMEEIREPILEANKCIEDKIKENKKLLEANTILKHQLDKAEATQYLVESTANLPSEAKNFVRRVLKDSDKSYIKENLAHVISQYKKNVENNRNALLEKTLAERYTEKSKSATNNFSRRKLVESVAKQATTTEVDPERAQIQSIIGFCKRQAM